MFRNKSFSPTINLTLTKNFNLILKFCIFQSFNENENNAEEQSCTESFIEIIPYLFLALETIETTLACQLFAKADSITIKKDSKELEVIVDKTQQTYLNSEDSLLQYLEIMSLSCLLAIYKMNIETNKSALTPEQFNIELLMQILQTKRESDEDQEANNQSLKCGPRTFIRKVIYGSA